ncbi:MAG: hypothetical protein IT244_01415 [Bacteroidia bacterium]|nr:hypothetical protein [Bacteroidia bacterium]
MAIEKTQTDEIKSHLAAVGQQIKDENGLDNAIAEIEKYFNDEQKFRT